MIAEDIYQSLLEQVGLDNISGFIEGLLRQHLISESDLEEVYGAIAADTARESDAEDWADGLIGDGLARGGTQFHIVG